MTNKEILYRIINQAQKNGFKSDDNLLELIKESAKPIKGEITSVHIDPDYFEIEIWSKYIIFSHEFAKAFWGEERYIGNEWWIVRENYEHHLEVMVLEKEPLKYMEKFL